MTSQSQVQDAAARYTGQLRYMYSPFVAAPMEAMDEPIPAAVILANRAEDLARVSAELGLASAGFLDAEDVHVREGAEMKLLAQVATDVEAARTLLEAALAEEQGQSPFEAMEAAQTPQMQAAMEEMAHVLEQPIDAGMGPFVMEFRYRDLPPVDAPGAASALNREAALSLQKISQRAARTTAQAGGTLLRMDVDTLREGVSLISQEVANLIESIASDLKEAVIRLLKSALRLLLQAYDWVLALLGVDAEAVARRKVREWLDKIKGSNGRVNEDYVLRLIHWIYTPDVYAKEISEWLRNSNADMQTLADTTEAVKGLAERYEQKSLRLEKVLQVLALIGILPLGPARLPQFQVALAAITLGLMGYAIFTGYDHSDSGSAYFMNRFRIPIPDRVTGVRRTVQLALGIVDAPHSTGLLDPPFSVEVLDISDAGAQGGAAEHTDSDANSVAGDEGSEATIQRHISLTRPIAIEEPPWE